MRTTQKNELGVMAGFTIVEILIVCALIGLLAAIAVPNFIRSRQVAQTSACLNNLRLIDNTKTQWAFETGHNTGDAVSSSDLQPYLAHSANSHFPTCPIGGDYNINLIGVNPTCPNAVGNGTNTHNAVLN